MNGQLWVVLSPFIHWNKNKNEEKWRKAFKNQESRVKNGSFRPQLPGVRIPQGPTVRRSVANSGETKGRRQVCWERGLRQKRVEDFQEWSALKNVRQGRIFRTEWDHRALGRVHFLCTCLGCGQATGSPSMQASVSGPWGPAWHFILGHRTLFRMC